KRSSGSSPSSAWSFLPADRLGGQRTIGPRRSRRPPAGTGVSEIVGSRRPRGSCTAPTSPLAAVARACASSAFSRSSFAFISTSSSCVFFAGWRMPSIMKGTRNTSTSHTSPMKPSASMTIGGRFCSASIARYLLHVEPEVDHVAFLHDVRLALEPELARLACALLAAPRDEAVVRDDLCADEAFLKIGMDHAGRVVGRRVLLDRPRTDLFRPRRVERLEAQQTIRRADEAIEARLLEPELLQELGAFVLGELCDLGLDRRRDRDDLRALRGGVLADSREQGIVVAGALRDVRD